mmetsp:Transcript_5641/g.14529  ORF Transcript_5641/g.14529 Transcript_5641/m.14529 type:complete len:159 (+) Transcript_5641:193-669(+)
MGLFFALPPPDDAVESLETCASTVARTQMLAQRVWPDLLLRLGVPRIDGRQPIVIARFSAGQDGGERCCLLTLDTLNAIKQKVDRAPADKQRDDWQRAFFQLPEASAENASLYSEYPVPRSAAALPAHSNDVTSPTKTDDFEDDGEVKESEYLLMDDN